MGCACDKQDGQGGKAVLEGLKPGHPGGGEGAALAHTIGQMASQSPEHHGNMNFLPSNAAASSTAGPLCEVSIKIARCSIAHFFDFASNAISPEDTWQVFIRSLEYSDGKG